MDLQFLRDRPLAVIGAGVMGAGIAQSALLAGHPVRLFDARAGAAAAAAEQMGRSLAALVAKGRVDATAATTALARLRVAATLQEVADAALVIEAIVENLELKRALLRDLEALVDPGCVLASNTSSLSITALACGLQRPGRVVGLHFFNPVAAMRLVEVVSGLATEPAVAEAVHALAQHWGKTAVHAKSTPGFIVNRIARPFYAQALALLQQRAATPAAIDACVRGAGFRMGPCELMDLIGHDTNFAVTQAVFAANFHDRRYQPSPLQREMIDGGLLGRKSGRGFYDYSGCIPITVSEANSDVTPEAPHLPGAPWALCGAGPVADLLAARLAAAGLDFIREPSADESQAPGLRFGASLLLVTDGHCATERAARLGVDDLALFDWPVGPAGAAAGEPGSPAALACCVAEQASPEFARRVQAVLRALGWEPRCLADTPGLVVARTLVMLINEACDAVEQGVCDARGADLAMTLGVNYPAGPFAWLAEWGAPACVRLLDALDEHHRGECYRVSPRLRRAALVRPAWPAQPAAR